MNLGNSLTIRECKPCRKVLCIHILDVYVMYDGDLTLAAHNKKTTKDVKSTADGLKIKARTPGSL